MSKSAKTLVRTNPIFTSNYKLTIDDDAAYLNSFDADEFLSENRFKDKRISFTGFFERDLYRFWENGQTPLDYVFRLGRVASDEVPVKSFDLQSERLYAYGAEVNLSKAVKKRLKIFAPLYTCGKLPSKFVIFRMKDPSEIKYDQNPSALILGVTYKVAEGSVIMTGKEYKTGEIFVATTTAFTPADAGGKVAIYDSTYEDSIYDIDLLLKKADIIKTYDLVDTNIGKYLNNLVTNPMFPKSPINVDFRSMEIHYTGIDIRSGVMCTKPETFAPRLRELTEVMEFEDYVTKGFVRNGLVMPNMLNLEFCFDDDMVNSANRYFGLYCDPIDFASISINLTEQFRVLYPQKHLFAKSIPHNYDKTISDTGGIKVAHKDVEGFTFEDFSVHQKMAFYYFKNAQGTLGLLNKETFPLVLRKTSGAISDLFGLNAAEEATVIEFKDSLDNGSFKITGVFTTGNKITIKRNGLPAYEVTADHLPTYNDGPYGPGQSVANFFYPTGVKTEIARGITAALNYVLKESTLIAVQFDDLVVIYQQQLGGISQGYSIESDGANISIPFSRITGGGFDTRSRVKILEPVDSSTLVGRYLKTKIGWSKITNVSRIYSPDAEPTINTKEDIESYLCVAIENPGDEIIIQNGKVMLYDTARPAIGTLSVYDVCDFDFDTFTSEYSRSYSNEYKRYFDVQSGQLAPEERGRVVLHYGSTWGAGSGFTLSMTVGSTYTVVNYIDPGLLSHHEIVQDIINQINLNTPTHECVASLLDGYKIQITVFKGLVTQTPVFVLTPISNFNIFLDTTIAYGQHEAETYILYQIGSAVASIKMGDGTVVTGSPSGVNFDATSKTYTITAGTPRIINKKYLNDAELIGFSGFNTLSTKINKVLNPTVDKKMPTLSLGVGTEYDQFSENVLRKNVLRSKTVPHISKWVRRDSKDIRDNQYRLNMSLAFNEFGFSPSSYDKNQNPKYFTHEWFYLGGLPGRMPDDDLKASTSYFDARFETDRHADKLHDYFTQYFTIEKLREIEVPRQERFSRIRQENGEFITFFKGSEFRFKNPDGTNYDGYKFSCVLNIHRTYCDINRYPLTFEFIDNKDHKNIVLVINLVVDDYKVVPYVGSRFFGQTTEQQDEIYYEYLYLYCMRSVNTVRPEDPITPSFGYRIYFPDFSPTVAAISNTISDIFKPIGSPDDSGEPTLIPYFDGIKTCLKWVGDDGGITVFYDDTKIPVTELLTENSSRDYGIIYAIDTTSKTMFASAENAAFTVFLSKPALETAIGLIDAGYITITIGPDTIYKHSMTGKTLGKWFSLGLGSGILYSVSDEYWTGETSSVQKVLGNSVVYAGNNPETGEAFYFYSLLINNTLEMSDDVPGVWSTLFDFTKLEWYQNGGGKDYYVGISKYLSFAKFIELNNSESPLIQWKEIVEGNVATSSLRMRYMEPDRVHMSTGIRVDEGYLQLADYPDVTIAQRDSAITDVTPYILFRYSGAYEPKFKSLVKFGSSMVDQPFFMYDEAWVNNYYSNIDDTKGKLADLQTVLSKDLGIFWDQAADGHRDLKEFVHKYTKDNYPAIAGAVVDARIPQEMSIISRNFNITKPYISRDYFLQDESVGVFGGENVNDIKSYLATPVFVSEDTLTVNLTSLPNGADINVVPATYTEVGDNLLISVNLYNVFKNYYGPKVQTAWQAFIDASSISTDFDTWVSEFVRQNLYPRYDFTTLDMNQKLISTTGITINTETDRLKLLAGGFTQMRNLALEFDKANQNIILLTMRKPATGGQTLNIKLSFVHK